MGAESKKRPRGRSGAEGAKITRGTFLSEFMAFAMIDDINKIAK